MKLLQQLSNLEIYHNLTMNLNAHHLVNCEPGNHASTQASILFRWNPSFLLFGLMTGLILEGQYIRISL